MNVEIVQKRQSSGNLMCISKSMGYFIEIYGAAIVIKITDIASKSFTYQ